MFCFNIPKNNFYKNNNKNSWKTKVMCRYIYIMMKLLDNVQMQ